MVHEVVAISTLSSTAISNTSTIDVSADWRKKRWRDSNVIVGAMAKDACATEFRRCATILILLDPLIRLATEEKPAIFDVSPIALEQRLHKLARNSRIQGNTLLDVLLPLGPSELGKLADPRAARINQYGPGNSAEAADAISRLETDAFLVLLADDPKSSNEILNFALKTRPDALRVAKIALKMSADRSDAGQKALQALTAGVKNSLKLLLANDNRIYQAAKRIFDAQREVIPRRHPAANGAGVA